MIIKDVVLNNRKRVFEISTSKGVFPFPYSRVDPVPSKTDPVMRVYVDSELGREGFTFILKSGAEGSLHVDSVLEYNEEPTYMRDLLVYKLTIEARKRMASSHLAKREVIRRARTSPAQLYRLLDVTNKRKSVDKLIVLLSALDCEVDFTVRDTHTTIEVPRRMSRL